MTRLASLAAAAFLTQADAQFLLVIAQAAEDVRDRQKTYFKERTQDNLTASKNAERLLDRLIAEPAQGSLL